MAKRIAIDEDVIWSEAPIEVPEAELAGIAWMRFREAANTFRYPPTIRTADFPLDHIERCGQWLIDSHKAGLIPERPHELIEFIEWHDLSTKNLDDISNRFRGPYNLMMKLAGGALLPPPKFLSTNERGEKKVWAVCHIPKSDFMTRVNGGHLALRPMERYAATCEYLASRIEERITGQARSWDNYRVSVPSVYGEVFRGVYVDKHYQPLSKTQWEMLKLMSDKRSIGARTSLTELRNIYDHAQTVLQRLLGRKIENHPDTNLKWDDLIEMAGKSYRGYQLL